jgi:pectate lyase
MGRLIPNRKLNYWKYEFTISKKSVLVSLLGFCCMMIQYASAQYEIPSNIAFGNATKGGLNGKIIRVTNLNATGPGSLREAIEAKGPRIVVFEVGGIIDLNKGELDVREPFLTIAGQTAPSPGITIIKGGFWINTHDILIQHIRVRPGDAGEPKRSGWSPDGLTTSGGDAYNVLVDHCSFAWAVDENLSASGERTEGPDSTSHNITFSNNIIAECLSNSSHEKGPHSKGTLIHDFCRDIAIVGNLFAHNGMRNPYFKAHSTGVIVNNLIYNPGRVAIQLFYSKSEWKNARYEPENCRVSIVGNVLYSGKNTNEKMALVAAMGDAFMKDNLAFDAEGMALPLTYGNINILSEKPVWPTGLMSLPADEVVGYITGHVGARPKERDVVDKRIIQDFLDKKGQILDSQDEVGGYPKYKAIYRKLEVPEEDIDSWLMQLASELQ